MSLKTFIADLRKIEIPDDYEGGNDKQRTKHNKSLKVLRDIKTAANREADDGAADEDSVEIYCVFNGGLTLVRFDNASVIG